MLTLPRVIVTVGKERDKTLPIAVVVELVVTGVGDVCAKSCSHGEKYLHSSINPHLEHIGSENSELVS